MNRLALIRLQCVLLTCGWLITGCLGGADFTTANNDTPSPTSTSSASSSPTTTSITTQPTPTPSPTPTPAKITGPQKSIKEWAKCDGVTDDNAAVVKALAAAAGNTFTLVVDCPVNIHIGIDIKRPIYIDNDTTVVFTGAGKFIVDNMFVPAFVLADTTNVTMTNWNVEFNAITPVSGNTGGYEDNGVFVAVKPNPKQANGNTEPAGAFNGYGITDWLHTNRNITFERVTAIWAGGVNPMSVFSLTGDTSNITITGMQLYAPKDAGGDAFIPVAFSFTRNFKPNQTVGLTTPLSSTYVGTPHNITISDITLDGTIMGFLGGCRDTVFKNITSNRYSDVQDANGNHSGGLDKWFPPPHLFYIASIVNGDLALINSNIQLEKITDNGIRVGVARDDGISTPLESGYANSLKIGGTAISVDNYITNRPDGFMDVKDVVGDGMTISNVTVTYNSQFLHGRFPGWRFPASPYTNLTATNVSITDLATVPASDPMSGTRNVANKNIVMSNINLTLNSWPNTTTLDTTAGGTDGLLAMLTGTELNANINYLFTNDSTKIQQVVKSTVSEALQASSSSVKSGDSVILSWSSTGATGCTASGGWSGSVKTSGSQMVKVSSAVSFVLTCANSQDSATATIPVTILP